MGNNSLYGYYIHKLNKGSKMENYKYRGFKLTASIAEELILEIMNTQEQTLSRIEIGTKVFELHEQRGGLKNESPDPIRNVIKKALTNLQKQGVLVNNARQWILNRIDDTSLQNDIEVPPTKPLAQNSYQEEIKGECIGSGESCVYVYYTKDACELARYKNEEFWAHKIGKTDHANPIFRIREQLQTAASEPVVSLTIKTDQPNQLEKAIHQLLILMNRQIEEAIGMEWFVTSTEEVKKLYSILSPLMR